MEPLKPEVQDRLLELRPEADPADIEEYERLLSSRFAADPDRPSAQPEDDEMESLEDRLRELYHKLFGENEPA